MLQHAHRQVSMSTCFLMPNFSFFIASFVMTAARSHTLTSELRSAAGSSSGFSFSWLTLAGRSGVTSCGRIPMTILLSSTRRRSSRSLLAYGRQPFCRFFTKPIAVFLPSSFGRPRGTAVGGNRSAPGGTDLLATSITTDHCITSVTMCNKQHLVIPNCMNR